jgi:predicted porin
MCETLERDARSALARQRGAGSERPWLGRGPAVLAATVSFVLAAMAGSAGWAADLGGNCCADLEERVAELEATTVRKGNRRISLTLSGQVSRALMYWDDSFQSDVYSVDNGLNSSRFRLVGSAKVGADVAVGFMMEMDMRIGSRSNQVNQVDDDGFSGSQGILGGAPLGDGIGGAGDSVIGIRTANWWVESKHWGKLTVGRLNLATGGISVIDLSNMSVVVTSEPGEFQGGFLVRNGLGVFGSTWANLCGGPSVAGPYSSDCFEHGPFRRDAVRYDTPAFHGFIFSASWGEDDVWDAAVRYSGEWHGFRIAAGVGYRRYQDREPDVAVLGPPGSQVGDTDRSHWLASASIMHLASGLFLSSAYTLYEWHGTNANEVIGGLEANGNRPDIPLWWVGAGIEKNWTGWGITTFYGEYGRFWDGTAGLLAATAFPSLGPLGGGAFTAGTIVVDSEVTWWGAGVVQKIDAAAIDIYLAYRQYQADATISGGPANQIPGGLEDIWFIQAGARIQF